MKLIGQIEIDLDETFADCDSSVADIIREELRKFIAQELRKEFRENVSFLGAMKEIRERAAREIIRIVTKTEDLKEMLDEPSKD